MLKAGIIGGRLGGLLKATSNQQDNEVLRFQILRLFHPLSSENCSPVSISCELTPCCGFRGLPTRLFPQPTMKAAVLHSVENAQVRL